MQADNKARGRIKEHLVPKTYTKHDGTIVNTVGLSHNGWAKSKLVYVLGGSLMRKKNPIYSEVYNNYKNRLQNHPKYKDESDGHKHSMANRYMVKRFFADLYVVWKGLEGLEAYPPYEVAKLGLVHKKAA